VGIGASAGGLEAFTQLLRALPTDTGMAFVFVQHLDPTHATVLTDLLSRATRMPTRQIEDGTLVRPDHVYVIPPNHSLTIAGGILRLGSRDNTHGQHLPIDTFLASLAEDQGGRAIGVILSGTGSDGAVGLRAINNIVDVTNYVMFELGQPLYAFDLDKIGGKQIIVRTAREGEKLTSLDGHERKLSAGMLVIADASKPVALAGVMGGQDSEVSSGTVNVLLESARFEPLSIRKTARALAMKSDSSYRFERSIDPTLPDRASLRAAELILQLVV